MNAAGRRRADLAARAAAVAGNTSEQVETSSPAHIRTSAPEERRTSADADMRTPAPVAAPATTARPSRTARTPAVRTTPVRVTVELAPIEHRRLRQHCAHYADDLGVPQVAGAEVVRVLLGLLDADAQLAARVGEELRRTGGTRRR